MFENAMKFETRYLVSYSQMDFFNGLFGGFVRTSKISMLRDKISIMAFAYGMANWTHEHNTPDNETDCNACHVAAGFDFVCGR